MRGVADVRAAVDAALPAARADLERLVRIPSVSADPSARAHVEASAAEVARQLDEAGLPEVEVRALGAWAAGGARATSGPPGGSDRAALRPPRRAAGR